MTRFEGGSESKVRTFYSVNLVYGKIREKVK